MIGKVYLALLNLMTQFPRYTPLSKVKLTSWGQNRKASTTGLQLALEVPKITITRAATNLSGTQWQPPCTPGYRCQCGGGACRVWGSEACEQQGKARRLGPIEMTTLLFFCLLVQSWFRCEDMRGAIKAETCQLVESAGETTLASQPQRNRTCNSTGSIHKLGSQVKANFFNFQSYSRDYHKLLN